MALRLPCSFGCSQALRRASHAWAGSCTGAGSLDSVSCGCDIHVDDGNMLCRSASDYAIPVAENTEGAVDRGQKVARPRRKQSALVCIDLLTL